MNPPRSIRRLPSEGAHDAVRIEAARLVRLRAWVRDHGGSVAGVGVRRRRGLRGLVAEREFATGEALLRIPRPLLLTVDVAAASPAAQRLADAGATLSDEGLLGLFLAQARADGNGFWRPFVDSLPAHYDELPMAQPAADWQALQGSCAQRLSRAWRANLLADWRQIRRALPAQWRPALRDFVWGWQSATTRSYNLRIDGRVMGAMVPLADMMNARLDGPSRWGGDQSDGFVFQATGTCPAGEEITGPYDCAPNTRLLSQYGFALEDNPHDRVRLRVVLTPGHFAWSGRLPHDGVAPGYAFDVGHGMDVGETRQLLAFLRLTSLPDEATARRHPGVIGAPSGLRIPALDAPSERLALQRLRAACEARLADFPQSLEEDAVLLADDRMGFTRRAAVITRLGEKRLLRAHLALTTLALPALALPEEARDTALQRLAVAGGAFGPYFDECRRALAHQSAPAVAA